MRLVSHGLRMWCFTRPVTRKYKQMMVNHKVAFAIENLQVEGVAELKGHPYDDENADFLEAYRELNLRILKGQVGEGLLDLIIGL